MGTERKWDRELPVVGQRGPVLGATWCPEPSSKTGQSSAHDSCRSLTTRGRTAAQRSRQRAGPRVERVRDCERTARRLSDKVMHGGSDACCTCGCRCGVSESGSVDGAGRGWTGLWMVGSMASTHFDAHYTQDETAQHCCAVVGNR